MVVEGPGVVVVVGPAGVVVVVVGPVGVVVECVIVVVVVVVVTCPELRKKTKKFKFLFLTPFLTGDIKNPWHDRRNFREHRWSIWPDTP